MPDKMVSTLTLARLCGVSQGTVDRALHGRPGISGATRERILRAAARHGYRPHPAAREILDGRAHVVQAIFPTVNNLLFMDLMSILAEALERRNLRLQITLCRESADLLNALEDAAARRQTLALVIPPEDGINIPRTLTVHLPVLSLFSPCRNAPFLSPDEETTGADGTQHLFDAGHRKIIFLSSRRRAHAVRVRAAGYRKRMRELGLSPKVLYSEEAVLAQRKQATAIFCHNDWLAIRLMLRLRKEGVAVPEELSVLGIDRGPTLTALFPDLTSMAYPLDALVTAILARLDGEECPVKTRFPVIPGRTVAISQGGV